MSLAGEFLEDCMRQDALAVASFAAAKAEVIAQLIGSCEPGAHSIVIIAVLSGGNGRRVRCQLPWYIRNAAGIGRGPAPSDGGGALHWGKGRF
jgi:hypothetical protein